MMKFEADIIVKGRFGKYRNGLLRLRGLVGNMGVRKVTLSAYEWGKWNLEQVKTNTKVEGQNDVLHAQKRRMHIILILLLLSYPALDWKGKIRFSWRQRVVENRFREILSVLSLYVNMNSTSWVNTFDNESNELVVMTRVWSL